MLFHLKVDDANRARFDDALRTIAELAPGSWFGDNLITIGRTMGFLTEPGLLDAFRRHADGELEQSLLWRMNTLVWAARQALLVEGDFVECGVYRAFSMAVVADAIDFGSLDRRMWLYDTFDGIPDDWNSEQRSNAVYRNATLGDPDAIRRAAAARIAHHGNVDLVRGIVPEVLHDRAPDQVAFLHLDLNASAPELAALELLFPRMPAGAVIVLDDHGWFGYEAQAAVHREFFSAVGHSILELPTGQGLVIRH